MWRLVTVLGVVGCSSASKLGGSFDCVPDASVAIACTSALGRECSGRPIMSVCDGMVSPDACLADSPMPPLIVVDRPPGCPSVNVTCPASGSLAVGISQGGSGLFTCTWAHKP